MSRSSKQTPEPESVVVARGPADGDTGLGSSPRSWVLVVMALLSGLALGFLFSGGFHLPSSEEFQPPVSSSTTLPGVASVSLVEEFAEALAGGDPVRIGALVDEEPVVLQLPGVGGLLSTTPPSAAGETVALAAGLGFRLTLTGCQRKPLSERGAELYDEMLTCEYSASNGLSERLHWPPETGQMQLGVRDGRIRAIFSSSTSYDYWSFSDWVASFRPHLYVHWLNAWGRAPVDGAELAGVLLAVAVDYAAWIEDPGAPPALRPEGGTGPTYRAGHVMVYDPVTDRVLLLGGATTFESSDSWGDPTIWGFDHAARTWTVWEEQQLIHETASAAYDLESGLLVVITGEMDERTESWVTSILTYAPSTGAWDEKKSSPILYEPGWGWGGWGWGLPSEPRAVYDAGSDRVVVAERGGRLWAYDVDEDTWVELHPPSPSPCEFFGQNMAYDAGADRIVLSANGELCVYDLDTNTLTARSRGGAPDEVSAVAYDEQSGLVVILGDGFVWAYHTPSGLLEQIGPIADGVLWRNAAIVYQLTSDRMVVFDGGRTWGYHLDSDQWVQLEP